MIVEVCQSASQSAWPALAVLTERVRHFCRMRAAAWTLAPERITGRGGVMLTDALTAESKRGDAVDL